MSVLKVLQEPSIRQNNYLIPLIKAKLEVACIQEIHIQFIWIPSHKGICGNEIADELARRAIKEGMATNFKVPHSDLFSKNKKPWYYNISLSRETIVTVSRIRSNNYNINSNINHIVFCCPNTRNKSIQLRSAIVSVGHHSMDIFEILKNPTNKICRLIIAFCKTCNMKI
ncbi:hypothetical protein ACFW04_013811 [Cataglyphis niger]